MLPRFALPSSFGAALALAAALAGHTLLLAHFVAPLGWLLAPVILYQAVRPLNAVATRRGWPAGFVLTGLSLVCLQDLGLVLYTGGTHDAEGRGWLAFMTLASALGVFTQLIDLVTPIPRPRTYKVAVLLLFLLGFGVHLRYAPL